MDDIEIKGDTDKVDLTNAELLEMIKIMQKKIQELEQKTQKQTINSNNNNNNTNNTNTNSNNVTNNNQTINQTINIVGFGKEDISKLDKKEIFRCLKSGFCYPTEMTMYINFNENFPENHNIQIPNVRENNVRYYDGKSWNTVTFNDFYNDMIDQRMGYYQGIKSNGDVIYVKLPSATKAVLEQIDDLENIDSEKHKLIKQKLRNKIIDKRDITKISKIKG